MIKVKKPVGQAKKPPIERLKEKLYFKGLAPPKKKRFSLSPETGATKKSPEKPFGEDVSLEVRPKKIRRGRLSIPKTIFFASILFFAVAMSIFLYVFLEEKNLEKFFDALIKIDYIPKVPVTKDQFKNKEERKKSAREMLENNGWEFDEETKIWGKKTKKSESQLRFSLSTSDTPELKAVAEIIVEEWRELGAEVSLKIFESGDLNQNVIRPRKYDALLFGEIVSRELDLFAFWHSSQRNDPGLNIALYANITADKLLEDARAATDRNVMIEKYEEFEKEVDADVPAVFVYSPDFIYITPKNVKALELGAVTTPAERFLNIHQWYIATDKIWNFFAN